MTISKEELNRLKLANYMAGNVSGEPDEELKVLITQAKDSLKKKKERDDKEQSVIDNTITSYMKSIGISLDTLIPKGGINGQQY